MNYPKVSIIILNWNRLKDITECLEAVYKTDYPNYQVIVVDNASTVGSPEKIKALFPEVALIKNKENLGYAGGNNVGIKYAMHNGSSYFWLLNNDTVVAKETLANLVLSGEQLPNVGLLSPVIYDYFNKMNIQYCGSIIDIENFSEVTIKNLQDVPQSGTNDTYLWGTALLIKREVIERIGYLNEDYFAYFEDIDYSLRARKAGFDNKIEPSAYLFHKNHFNNEGVRQIPDHMYYYMKRNEYIFRASQLSGLNRIRFFQKYLSSSLRQAAEYWKKGLINECDTIIEGLTSALKGEKGHWNSKRRVPQLLKRIILWHPYFIADLIDLKFIKIWKIFFERILLKLCLK